MLTSGSHRHIILNEHFCLLPHNHYLGSYVCVYMYMCVCIYIDNYIYIIKFVILMTPMSFYISSYPCYITSHMFSGTKQMTVIVRYGLKHLHHQHTRCLNTTNLANVSLLWNVKQQHMDSITSVLSNNK
jgi:hypothetical protein